MAQEKIEPQLAAQLAALPSNATLAVLVFPRGDASTLQRELETQRVAGRLRFNPLPLAGCFVVEAAKAAIVEIATWPMVETVRANPPAAI